MLSEPKQPLRHNTAGRRARSDTLFVGSTPSIPPGTYCCTPDTGRGYVRSESIPRVEGTPVEQVRSLWAAYARGGVDAMHTQVGEAAVEVADDRVHLRERESHQ